MSCQFVNRDQGNEVAYNNSMGSFAPLDSAFSPSSSMTAFQNKMMCNNPLLSQNIQHATAGEQENVDTSQINDGIKSLITSKQVPDDKTVSPIGSNKVMSPKSPRQLVGPGNCQVFNRNQYFDPQKYGTTLLEGYDGQPVPAYTQTTTTTTEYGMSFMRLILLIILIAVLIYAANKLYQNVQSKSGQVTEISPSLKSSDLKFFS